MNDTATAADPEPGPPPAPDLLAPFRNLESERAAVAGDMSGALARQIAAVMALCETWPEEYARPLRKAARNLANSWSRTLARPAAASDRLVANRSLIPDKARTPLPGQMDLFDKGIVAGR